jgi:hypothetical protein
MSAIPQGVRCARCHSSVAGNCAPHRRARAHFNSEHSKPKLQHNNKQGWDHVKRAAAARAARRGAEQTQVLPPICAACSGCMQSGCMMRKSLEHRQNE